ncbi:hypothetical protein FALBO_6132 [Fusarium albosuccineum]|uniref:Uncharacterized protein n=1 Tax=Fusarium albosuccineum TaxID=1237068 RepID=A0A8H4PDM1_9HYPO|nr:hypothetical protein FALBO_6132 [Fusarium albosuccineum]
MLDRLPGDILNEIFCHFCLHCCGQHVQSPEIGARFQLRDRRPRQDPHNRSWYSLDRHALFSLSLSCKALRHVAQSFLYHEFVLGYGDSVRSAYYDFDNRLIPFVRTVGRRRDLAAKVRKVAIHPLLRQNIDAKQIRETLLKAAGVLGIDIIEAWKRRAADASEAEREYWSGSYGDLLQTFFTPELNDAPSQREKEKEDSRPPWGFRILDAELITMLIALLPNLNHLSLWQENNSPIRFCPSSFKALGITNLPNLKTLDTETNPDAIVALANGLETLNIRSISLFNWHATRQLPSVSTLRLTKVAYKRKELERIISWCTGNLCHFIYEARGREVPFVFTRIVNGVYEGPHFSAAHASKALGPHKETLQYFHLDLRLSLGPFRPASIYNEVCDAANFTLRDFTCLREVFLSTDALFAVPTDNDTDEVKGIRQSIADKMPSSLVSLYLAKDIATRMEDLQEGLIGLAQEKDCHPVSFPNLEHVSIDTEDPLEEKVGLIMAGANVNFVYESLPKSKDRPARWIRMKEA